MTKRMTIMILALLVVFGGIIAFNLIKGVMIKRFLSQFKNVPVTISSVKAIQKDWRPSISAVGNFVALSGVEVNSQASGNVTSIHFGSGQYIEKDQPLIDIDDSVEQAQLKFNQADQNLKQVNYKRQTDLLLRKATPSSSVDEAKANLEQAEANVEKVEAQIRQKHITAPFSGRLGIRLINLGQYITPGQTAIVTLQSLDPLYLEFNLPEQLFKKLHLKQKILFSVEGFANMVFRGDITAINSKIDPNTHNILVQATVPNCPAQALRNPEQSKLITVKQDNDTHKKIILCNSKLNAQNHIKDFIFIPGMFAAINVELPPIPNVVVLPSTAISYSLYGNSVFLIEKTNKKDDKGEEILETKRIFVHTGDQVGNNTVIEKGVTPGQLVVSTGELKLQNGTRVFINNDVQLNNVANPDSLGQ